MADGDDAKPGAPWESLTTPAEQQNALNEMTAGMRGVLNALAHDLTMHMASLGIPYRAEIDFKIVPIENPQR